MQSHSCSSPLPGASKHIAGCFAQRTVPTDRFSGKRNSAALPAPQPPSQDESSSLRPLCSGEASTPRHIPGWRSKAKRTGPSVCFCSCRPTTRRPRRLAGVCLSKRHKKRPSSSARAGAIKVMRPALRQCPGCLPPVATAALAEMVCSKTAGDAADPRGEFVLTGL